MKMKNTSVTSSTIDLSGPWKFGLGDGPSPTGVPDLDQTIQLPGSLQEQGFGDPISVDTQWTASNQDRSWYTSERYAPYRQPGNVKIPFWLQPEKHYVGTAWYQREVEIPAAWSGRRVTLFLERAHIQTTLWLDDREMGSHNTLGAPHSYELGMGVRSGKHLLTLRVDNRLHIKVGDDAHSVSDQTQTNWNGIIGRIELSAASPVWIDDAQAYPDATRRQVRVRVRIGNATGTGGKGVLSAGNAQADVQWGSDGGEAELVVLLAPNARLWDEFSPVLHRLKLQLTGSGADDTREITFGLLEVGVNGTQITVNGRKIFLRGTLECAVFPKTGYPPTHPDEWKRILKIIRDYGFNHVRFHSWCPPEAAFAMADELGLYFQIECSSWAGNGTSNLGEGAPVDAWLYEEARALIKAYGNHPSFLLMAYGNEPAGEHHRDYLAKWVAYWKKEEPRRLHTSAAGWPSLPENQYDNMTEPRVHLMGDRLTSPLNFLPPSTTADYKIFVNETPRPIISHEIGEWCVYPDFSEIPKYTGLLKAKNFEIFRDSLDANHMGDQSRDFLQASGKLQVLCYREDIEAALRTKGFGGFQVLQANDFPGQGTALVGWLNPFWESKGYTSPEEFRRFNNSTVLLARLERRIFSTRDTLRADIEVSHFEARSTGNAHPYWKLVSEDGKVHASGDLPVRSIPVDNGIPLGSIEVRLSDLPAPAKYRLVAGLTGTAFENDWEIWVYPSKRTGRPLPGQDVLLVREWDVLLRCAKTESKVFFLPPAGVFQNKIALGFSSIFWNTSWTNRMAPQTLGILCDPSHPALAGFPTEFHSNWQWWELIHGATALSLNHLPAKVRPIVQVIDDWFTNRRLGLLFEVRLGKCRVMVSGMELLGSMHLRHAARQLRQSVVDYMASPSFNPDCEIDQVTLGTALGYPNASGPEALPIPEELPVQTAPKLNHPIHEYHP